MCLLIALNCWHILFSVCANQPEVVLLMNVIETKYPTSLLDEGNEINEQTDWNDDSSEQNPSHVEKINDNHAKSVISYVMGLFADASNSSQRLEYRCLGSKSWTN